MSLRWLGLLIFFVAQPTPALSQTALDRQADTYLHEVFGDRGPGVAAIIVQDGQVLFEGATGLADVAASKKLTAGHHFQIGSISKPFVATAVLRLVEKGKLSLDDPIDRYMPDIADNKQITVGNLLNHSAGFGRGLGLGYSEIAAQDKLWSIRDLLSKFDGKSNFVPGTAQQYSNAGYTILGGILEKVTGRPWYEVVRDEAIAPAGVTTIYFRAERKKLERLPTGYLSSGKPAFPDSRYLVEQAPSGALIGDLEGMAKWFDALFAGKIISQDSLKLMTHWIPPEEGGNGLLGYGLERVDMGKAHGVGHSGRIPGFGTAVAYFPDRRLFVASFSNDDDTATPMQLATTMLAGLALGTPFTEQNIFAAPGVSEADWFGVYDGPGTVRFGHDDNGYFLVRAEGERQMLFPAGYGVYFPPEAVGEKWAVLALASDGSRKLEWHGDDAQTSSWTRSGDLPAENENAYDLPIPIVKALVGAYRLPVGLFTISLDEKSGALMGTLLDQPAMPLVAVSETRLAAPAVGATLDFKVDDDGKVQALTLGQGGQSMTAERVDE